MTAEFPYAFCVDGRCHHCYATDAATENNKHDAHCPLFKEGAKIYNHVTPLCSTCGVKKASTWTSDICYECWWTNFRRVTPCQLCTGMLDSHDPECRVLETCSCYTPEMCREPDHDAAYYAKMRQKWQKKVGHQ